MIKNQMLLSLDNIIKKLETHLSLKEIANGWTTDSQKIFLKIFLDMKKEIISGKQIPLDIARRLDYWGIDHGPLFDEIMLFIKKNKRNSSIK